MEEQFVNFDTAKLAKEKGFNEYCRKTFDTEGKSSNLSGYMRMKKWNINDKVHLYDTDSEEFENPDIECTQPTQSFLQKWLREEKKIRVYVGNSASGEFKYEINIVNPIQEDRIGKPWERKYNYTSYKTYEEALEKGLIESLKLI